MPTPLKWIERRFGSMPAARPIGAWQRIGLWLLAGVFIVFFEITLRRQAFGYYRMGDLGVFFRAAWAAREGLSIYQVTDGHGWHYLYPPLLASLLIPLADPLPGASAAMSIATLPYWLSCSIWYWLNVLFIVASLHIVATALESVPATAGSLRWPRYSEGWWALRVWPFLMAIIPLGDSLGAGQTTALVLFLLSCAGAALLRGRRVTAGFCVGLAGMIKIFPFYLIIYPLFRRDRQMLLGAMAGAGLGLLLPFALMGPVAAGAAYKEFFYDRLWGDIEGHASPVLAQETHGTGARIQSFEYMIYNVMHPHRSERQVVPPSGYFAAHLLVSAAVTAAALLAMRRRGDVLAEFLFFAVLVQLAVPISPVSRPHYYAFGTIALAGLLAAKWRPDRGMWPGWAVMLIAVGGALSSLLVAVDERFALDFGLVTYASLALCGIAIAAARGRPVESGSLDHAGPVQSGQMPQP